VTSFPPKLIIINSFAGAGKTTVAKKLSADFGLPLFSSDAFGKSLLRLVEKHIEKSPDLKPTIYPMAYDLLFEIMEDNLKSGLTLILDANMCQSQTRESIERLKKDIPELLYLPIILDIDLETAKNRVQKRKNLDPINHDLDSAGIEKIITKYEFIKKINYPGLIKIDANRNFEDIYIDVVKLVEKFVK